MKTLPFIVCGALLTLHTFVAAAPVAPSVHNITLVERLLYGPGPMPDQKLGKGHVHNMPFSGFMRSTVPGSNNGAEAPNVSGEALQGGVIDGRLSDGTLINENIDMGNALLLQGRFNLLLGAVHGGPNQGNSRFFLDEKLNWTIQDDIAIDPGFAEGIVRIKDFTFTTGPTFVPHSVQTKMNYPGGVDLVGSLVSGDVVAGRIGDDDRDGKVDGIFIALGNFPLDAILLPGAPFVQSIEFESDIPLHPLDAALLTTASARNRLLFLREHTVEKLRANSVRQLIAQAQTRLTVARAHMERASAKATCAPDCAAARDLHQRISRLQISGDPAQALASLGQLESITEELMSLHVARTGEAIVETSRTVPSTAENP
jgi:hypothetical protein